SNQQVRRGSLQQVELFPDRPIPPSPVVPAGLKTIGEKPGAEKALPEKDKAVTGTDRRGSGDVAQKPVPTTTSSTLKTVTVRGATSTAPTTTTTVRKGKTKTAFGPEITRPKIATTVPTATSTVPGTNTSEKEARAANVEKLQDESGAGNE